MKIGPYTIQRVLKSIETQLTNEMASIDEVYQRNDDDLSVAIKLDFYPNKRMTDGVFCDVSLSYTKSKFKETDTVVCSESQAELPLTFPE